MSRERFKIFLLAYQLLAGVCDTMTGVLLVVVPAWTLTLMGVTSGSFPPVAASFVGTFVLSVGLIYLYALRLPMTPDNAPRWQTVWMLTALIRFLVAGFLFWQMAVKHMEFAWATVALTDGALATMQWIGLKRGWLEFDSAK